MINPVKCLLTPTFSESISIYYHERPKSVSYQHFSRNFFSAVFVQNVQTIVKAVNNVKIPAGIVAYMHMYIHTSTLHMYVLAKVFIWPDCTHLDTINKHCPCNVPNPYDLFIFYFSSITNTRNKCKSCYHNVFNLCRAIILQLRPRFIQSCRSEKATHTPHAGLGHVKNTH